MTPRPPGSTDAHPPASGRGPGTEEFTDAVQAALEEFLGTQQRRLAPLGQDGSRLLAAARASVSGGKRLRASFCRWGYLAVRPEQTDPDGLVRACAAWELLHASALVHDDYMDASDLRRGRPTTHRAFAAEHHDGGWAGSAEQYGAAGAILAGDLLLSWADEMLRRCGLDQEGVRRALAVLDECRTEVIAGQFLDVSVQARGHADVDAAMTVLRYKSAKYSVERPLHLGAALAGGTEDVVTGLREFGLPLGEAFQLRDDLLGVYGDADVTGKPAGDDLAEGKRTVLVALALDAAGPEDAALLQSALGQPLSAAELDRVREIIDATGARSQVEDVIEQLTGHAVAALERAPIDDTAREELRGLADAATRRVV